MSVMAHFSIFPVDKGESLSTQVARAIDVIRKSGLKYRIDPMGTTMEGEWEEIVAVVSECRRVLKSESSRIVGFLKFDDRDGREDGMTEKLKSIEAKLAD